MPGQKERKIRSHSLKATIGDVQEFLHKFTLISIIKERFIFTLGSFAFVVIGTS